MARSALPEEVSLQVPPNLAPAGEVVDCGIDDLGGVSPVTDDHINPDYAWPGLDVLRDIADDADVPLRERLPVYERYLPGDLRSGGFEGTPARAPAADGGDGGDGARRPGDPGSPTGEWVPERVREAIRAETEGGRRFRAVLRGESL
jgi:FO synthase subunit 1